MVKLIWTDLALNDLKEIHQYIAKDSKLYAKRQVSKIIKKAEKIIKHLFSGRIVPEFSDDSIREMFEGNYRVIYKLNDGEIFLTRIHHSSRLLKVKE